MTHTIGNITFGAIKNVKKSGDEEAVYFADVEMQFGEDSPVQTNFYCARADDYTITGRWVYQQIVNGNIVGPLTQLAAGADFVTGLVPERRETAQPLSQGAQTL